MIIIMIIMIIIIIIEEVTGSWDGCYPTGAIMLQLNPADLVTILAYPLLAVGMHPRRI